MVSANVARQCRTRRPVTVLSDRKPEFHVDPTAGHMPGPGASGDPPGPPGQAGGRGGRVAPERRRAAAEPRVSLSTASGTQARHGILPVMTPPCGPGASSSEAAADRTADFQRARRYWRAHAPAASRPQAIAPSVAVTVVTGGFTRFFAPEETDRGAEPLQGGVEGCQTRRVHTSLGARRYR